jgi:hypothetical protein
LIPFLGLILHPCEKLRVTPNSDDGRRNGVVSACVLHFLRYEPVSYYHTRHAVIKTQKPRVVC